MFLTLPGDNTVFAVQCCKFSAIKHGHCL